jgi:histidine triad (HIT) family protein
MKECSFCNIINRITPAEILYENEDVIAILDINPIHYGHSLIIPRIHCKDFLELPECTYHSILKATNIVTRALVNALKLDGFNLFSNNGHIAGQSVFHFHLHITPRYQEDNIRFVLNLRSYSDGEMSRYGELIRSFINPPNEKKN